MTCVQTEDAFFYNWSSTQELPRCHLSRSSPLLTSGIRPHLFSSFRRREPYVFDIAHMSASGQLTPRRHEEPFLCAILVCLSFCQINRNQGQRQTFSVWTPTRHPIPTLLFALLVVLIRGSLFEVVAQFARRLPVFLPFFRPVIRRKTTSGRAIVSEWAP